MFLEMFDILLILIIICIFHLFIVKKFVNI